jgi:mannose-6-phosphate isomerase-like protein (cupin superfamily)
MASTAFAIKTISTAPEAIAPDGSEVRLLCAAPRGSMAVFRLPPGGVSKAVVHRTVEEVWYFTGGRGRLWRKAGEQEEVTEVAAGVSIAILPSTHFQFRCDGAEPLEAVAVTMPPWPGAVEAYFVTGEWQATA